MTTFSEQLFWLFTLSIPIACIAWTVTHEEIFKEPRNFCIKKSKECNTILQRKFFYLFTCEYCFSHYVTLLFVLLTDFKLLLFDWRGYVIAVFSLVWIANLYMSIFGFIRVGMKREKMDADIEELKLQEILEDCKEEKNEE
jgi:hypothetical protein